MLISSTTASSDIHTTSLHKGLEAGPRRVSLSLPARWSSLGPNAIGQIRALTLPSIPCPRSCDSLVLGTDRHRPLESRVAPRFLNVWSLSPVARRPHPADNRYET